MATSLSSQLQTIKSLIQADSEPLRRPFTRPSVLFSPKEAADLDIDTIYSIALSGLDVLVNADERFRNYKSDLFSHKSKELDRELMTPEENGRINTSISSYLRLLSGHFQLLSSLKTLEYLLRRYKIHVYNMEDLILCALPFHDTHAFVRIVQLVDFGNTKWRFLEGVKVSGAPPPRQVIVQQCIRDLGVLEAICNYASPTGKFQPSRPILSFCTAVAVEAVGSFATVESDVVKRILPFAVSGIQPGRKRNLEHKASALMIVGLLASKAALSPKLVKTLVRSLAESAREDAEASTDVQWVRLMLMALINVVQSQSLDVFPMKALESLKEIRDITGILLGLSKEFNIDKFLALLLGTLVEHSSSDNTCYLFLISMIESIPIGDFVDRVVFKIMLSYTKLSPKKGNLRSSELGGCGKNIMIALMKNYPSEVRVAVGRFMEVYLNSGRRSGQGEMGLETLSKALDGNSDSPLPMIDSKILFSLHHPKAEVRCAALVELKTSSILKSKPGVPQRLEAIQDALLSQLHDDDLTVVQAALSLIDTLDAMDGANILQTLHSVLQRCVRIFLSGSDNTAVAGDIIVLCFEHMVARLNDSPDSSNEFATMIFPLLLIIPKTRKYNFKALEFAKKLNWAFYQNLPDSCSSEKKLEPGSISKMNQKIVDSMAVTFFMHPQESLPWLVKSSGDFMLSRTLFFLVLMQSFAISKRENKFFELFETCFPVLKTQWELLSSSCVMHIGEQLKTKTSEGSCTGFLDQLSDANVKELNPKILIGIFWELLEAFISVAPMEFLSTEDQWFGKLQEFFAFLAGASTNHAFREHLHYLVTNCKSSPSLLSGFFTAGVTIPIQVESLHCYAFLCAQSEDSFSLQLLAEAPSVLVPLASENQEVRSAAMNCLEGLHALCSRIDFSSKKNGNFAIWSHFLEELLSVIVQQKRLIVSDRGFLSSLLTSLISHPGHHNSLLVPRNTEQRFNESIKEKILGFILGSALKFSPYGKLVIFSLLKGIGNALVRVKDVEQLLSDLMKRCGKYFSGMDKSFQKLSKYEVDILCLLLESCATPSIDGRCIFEDHLLKALQLPRCSVEDPALILPCIAVLNKLNNQIYSEMRTEMQELLLRELVFLVGNVNGDVQYATKEALLRLEVPSSIVAKMLSQPSELDVHAAPQERRKKKKSTLKKQQDSSNRQNTLSFLGSLLDILLMKKNISNRESLIGPLFKLIKEFFSADWLHGSIASDERSIQSSSDTSETTTSKLYYILQMMMLVLEDIVLFLGNASQSKDEIFNEIDISLLLSCARSDQAGIVHGHILSLLSTIAKVVPEKFLNHMSEVLTVLGESAVTEIDSQSQRVFESVISSIVPFWLSKANNMEQVLKIFVNILPEVSAQRRLSIIIYLLRILGEQGSLASLLSLLFQSLITRKDPSQSGNSTVNSPEFMSVIEKEWEYGFAVQICEHYSSIVWLPALAVLLKHVGGGSLSRELFIELLLAMHFISQKLQDPELSMVLDSGENSDNIQGTFGEILEQIVSLLHLVDVNKKQIAVPSPVRKDLKEIMRSVLMNITKSMTPSSYFSAMIKLFGSKDQDVREKALGLLSKAMKVQDREKLKHKGGRELDIRRSRKWVQLDGSALEAFHRMCSDIVHLIDASGDNSNISLKLAAISAVEVLAYKFPTDYSIFSSCLASITMNIGSESMELSSSCLRAAGALINVLGQKALTHLPPLMENLIKISLNSSSGISGKNNNSSASCTSRDILLSVLVSLEAVVDKLGSFLNPYLEKIGELLVLHPELASGSDVKLKTKADAVRNLIAERIPVRLALPPLMKLYSNAVRSGDSSLEITFKMLGKIISSMDRSSVGAYHARIFDLCLKALDLRRQRHPSIRKIHVIEYSVITSMISLTMKLTETMFKPLFIRTIEWAESEVDDSPRVESSSNTDRAISFYGLVNKLAENHRSLFVPYFRYLLDGSIRHLSESEEAPSSSLTQKKKKARVLESQGRTNSALSHETWHLRALVVSALHKCFLYDTGSLKFLDSSNFQVLLKPIVSQLVIEPPAYLEECPDIPSVQEVDDTLVICIGQMAVTAGSDLLWKPLNHEVLMQTRSEKVRARILGLRIVKYLVENLKEEYLVFLAETIPFLGELLEDVELSVKTLAQDILKEMESLSGESLRQYL
ncbi:uncharacterized protein At3g06530 isoform X2 [Punica granatum]|uniref:Uncharacterized protein At3g06530 isoform X2 n=1 Tax=Punica granatum TaxID=22663 RepID=A0A6P8DCA3_PUNGR|nr:uncharacterized protein At3g06530 isoform X2 [Punica granatum]